MSLIKLHPASSASLVARANCMNAAYADYMIPLHVDADQIALMDLLYDVDVDASVVAEDRGRLVGMALLSRRGERGWISGVGTVPAFRRMGIARRMMAALIGNARTLKLSNIILEVIGENERAHCLYRSVGFVDSRELLTWSLPADADLLPIPQELLHEVEPEAPFVYFEAWHKEPPSWQREPETLRRLLGHARAYALELDGSPAAYTIASSRSDSVAILDVGINPEMGVVRAGRPLLQALSRLHPDQVIRILNVPADDPLCRVLAALRFHVTVRQWEMLLPL